VNGTLMLPLVNLSDIDWARL